MTCEQNFLSIFTGLALFRIIEADRYAGDYKKDSESASW